MTWTKEPPEKAGWYWCRITESARKEEGLLSQYCDYSPTIYKLDFMDYHGKQIAYLCDSDDKYFYSRPSGMNKKKYERTRKFLDYLFESNEWFGPLEPPP